MDTKRDAANQASRAHKATAPDILRHAHVDIVLGDVLHHHVTSHAVACDRLAAHNVVAHLDKEVRIHFSDHGAACKVEVSSQQQQVSTETEASGYLQLSVSARCR